MSEMTTAMRSGHSRRTRVEAGERVRPANELPVRARPLIAPAPRSAMFFPLVVLIAILPGLVALNSWDLTPPGPLWGLRALAVLDGLALDQVPAASEIKPVAEAAAFRAVSWQPPLYAWLAALGMRLSADLDPLASVLPSYVAGALVVILAYLHGRLWRGGGMGLAAALLVGFNPHLLLRMQEVMPVTLALAGVMGALLCYGWRERISAGAAPPWRWAGPRSWSALGGASLGVSLLALGGFGLLALPVVIFHQVSLRSAAASGPRERAITRHWRHESWWGTPAALAGVALTIALVVALPWHAMMLRRYGWEALAGLDFCPWGMAGLQGSLPARLLELSPVTVALGLFGFVRAIRMGLADEERSPATVGASLWACWFGVAALAPAFWPGGPRPALDLFLLIPLDLLAAMTVADLVNRRIPVRALIGLAPATAFSVAWWASHDLQGAFTDLWNGRANASTGLGVHLAIDLVIASVVLTRGLERWAQLQDDRQRQILALFLLSLLMITIGCGVREVGFRHGETHDLLALRTMILRRHRERSFDLLAVVGPEVRLVGARPSGEGPGAAARPYSGGWLRFVLRTTLPHLPQRDLGSFDDLLELPPGQRLIILEGTGQGLSSPIKSKLGLEAIHPGRSGILDAYATAYQRPPRK